MNMAVLASGTGRTLANFCEVYIEKKLAIRPSIVIVDRTCKAIDVAEKYGIPLLKLKESNDIFNACRKHNIDLVCLAGFLKKLEIPEDYNNNKVINIHPSLLPSFGGKGMYGHHVHQAVLDYGCKISGCTVHFVNDEYDSGPIIGQRTVHVYRDDSAESLANRVFLQECELYPECVNMFYFGKFKIKGRTTYYTSDASSVPNLFS
jgi:phosphoribosylglycinamide formyltransferase 1